MNRVKQNIALFSWPNIINNTTGLNIQHPVEKSTNPLDDEMRDSKANVDGWIANSAFIHPLPLALYCSIRETCWCTLAYEETGRDCSFWAKEVLTTSLIQERIYSWCLSWQAFKFGHIIPRLISPHVGYNSIIFSIIGGELMRQSCR